jgi:predicted subunit of tRNA(5-methylaminomethyl-2-thiouridylate) methyltransferase
MNGKTMVSHNVVLDKELMDNIKKIAIKEDRTVTGQIRHIVRTSVELIDDLEGDSINDVVRRAKESNNG